MKTKKMLFLGVSAAVAALISLASCGPQPVNTFTLSTTYVEVYAGEEFTVESVNASGDITWTINNEDGSFKASLNAGSTAMTITGEKAGSGSIKAVCGGVEVTCMVVVLGEEKEEVPVLLQPGVGLMRIAIRVPSGTCNGLYAIGDFSDNAGESNGWTHNKETCKFTKVADTETWYQLDITADGINGIKVCAVPESVAPGWDYQWGKNSTTDNVTVVEAGGSAVEFTIDNSENGGEVKLISFAGNDNGIIYLDV
ncbi:MAG: hypothetical protein KBA02_07120, partial [Paludibacteraceae bacterium]|nr:hypothetical protein [Paludibacteraceae bacterium]